MIIVVAIKSILSDYCEYKNTEPAIIINYVLLILYLFGGIFVVFLLDLLVC